MHHVYLYLGMASFWTTAAIVTYVAVNSYLHYRSIHRIGSVTDPFTRAEMIDLELRLRGEVQR